MSKRKDDNFTDAELISYYKSTKSNKWLGILLKRYHLLVFGVCFKYLKNEESAKDTTQQVFEKVIRELEKYEVAYFKSWLFMIAKNNCLMQLRSKQPKLNDIDSEEIPDFIEANNKERAIEKEIKLNKLAHAMTMLNEEQHQCITLFFMHKMSYRQIAEKTGMSELNVKTNIQNGKRNLKIMMNRISDYE